MIRGVPAEWGRCFRTVGLGPGVKALSCRNNTIAVGFSIHQTGSSTGNIAFLDAVTGSQTAVLHGHTGGVRCLAFSLDGKLLVSGGADRTVKLWDVQTGGVIRAFDGYEHELNSVSISADCARIASISGCAIYLSDVQTGAMNHISSMQFRIDHIHFSLINPRHLICISDGQIHKWDINGHAAGIIHSDFKVIPSLDYVLFAGHKGKDIRVQHLESGAIVAEFHTDHISPSNCCFSPDGKFAALSFHDTVEVWKIVGSNPSLIETLSCYNGNRITFSSPSILVSLSGGGWSVAFRKISDLTTEPSPKPVTFASAPIVSVSLQEKDGIAITSNSTGLVEIWDLSTGLCNTSFQSPATEHNQGDAKLISGRLVFAWNNHYESALHIWDSRNNNPSIPQCTHGVSAFMVSGDGSKIFYETAKAIVAWSVQAGELVGEVKVEQGREYLDPLHADGSIFWVRSKDLSTKEWDFGVPNTPSALLPNTPSERPCLDFIYGTRWQTGPCLIMDTLTGKEVFRLVGKHADPWEVKWDGRYLAAHYSFIDVLVLDFGHLYP